MVWAMDCRFYASGPIPTHALLKFFSLKVEDTQTLSLKISCRKREMSEYGDECSPESDPQKKFVARYGQGHFQACTMRHFGPFLLPAPY